MDDSLRQQLLPGTSQDDKHVVVKLLQLLSDNGINILEDHQEFLHHRPVTQNKPEKSREAENDCQDKSPLSIFYGGKNVDILQIAAAYVDKRNKFGSTPLHLSAEIGDSELVDMFLKVGADVHDNYNNIGTPLHWCAMFNHEEVVKVLLKAGAAFDVENMHEQTPLHCSAMFGYEEIVKILLKAGAAINVTDIVKKTPLHWSVIYDHTEVVKILLTAGATVDVEDQDKKTPLHWSAKCGHKKIVEILLKSGARVDAENEMKQTPLLLSLMNKHKDVAERLIIAGASVDIQDIYGNRALNYIADMRVRYGHKSMKRKILKLFYYKTESVKSTRMHASFTSAAENKDTISTRLVEGNTHVTDDNSSNKDSGLFCASPTAEESLDFDDLDHLDLNIFRQQVEDHWAKFSPEHREDSETSCSHDVKAAFQAGRIVMHTTINIKKKVIYYCMSGSQLNINKPQLAPVNSRVFIHQGRTGTHDIDVDEDSSSDEDTNKTS